MSTPDPRIIPNYTENRNPIFTQMVDAQRFAPIEGFGVVADQTPQKVVYIPAVLNEAGEVEEEEEGITLVPHNMRCEPPRGFNR